MTEKIKILLLAVLLAMGLMLASFLAGWKIRGEQMQPPIADTIRIERIDTVTLVEPMVDTLIRYVNRLYPVAVHDTMWRNDTMYVTLPYEHRYYGVPDTLDVWYSGVDPRIDSARVYAHHTTEIIRQPYEVAKTPRLTLDIGAAAFYADKSINPCLVGEMRYNAKKTTWSAYGAVNYEGKFGVGIGVSYRFDILK